MPKPFPAEFRRDVIAVARKGEASIAHVARDFGIWESCLQRWLKIADREDGLTSSAGADRGGGGTDEVRSCGSCAGGTSCWSRRTRSCGGPVPTSPGRPFPAQNDAPMAVKWRRELPGPDRAGARLVERGSA